MTTPTNEPPYEVLGTVRMVLPCAVTEADRKASDDALHALLDRQTIVRGQKARVRAASGKIRERLTALDEEIGDLHEQRKLVEVERTVTCEVRRTATQVLTVRLDTGRTHAQRPLTADEHQALHQEDLTGKKAAPPPAELTPDEVTARRIAAEAEHAQKLADLLQDFDLDAALAGATAGEEPAPKAKKAKAGGEPKKKPRKKKGGEQQEIPTTPSPANGAAPAGGAS